METGSTASTASTASAASATAVFAVATGPRALLVAAVRRRWRDRASSAAAALRGSGRVTNVADPASTGTTSSTRVSTWALAMTRSTRASSRAASTVRRSRSAAVACDPDRSAVRYSWARSSTAANSRREVSSGTSSDQRISPAVSEGVTRRDRRRGARCAPRVTPSGSALAAARRTRSTSRGLGRSVTSAAYSRASSSTSRSAVTSREATTTASTRHGSSSPASANDSVFGSSITARARVRRVRMVRGLIRSSGASMLAATCSGSGSATAPAPPRQVPPEASTCARCASRTATSSVACASWSSRTCSANRSTATACNPCAHDATRWVATTTDSACAPLIAATASGLNVDNSTASSPGCVCRTWAVAGKELLSMPPTLAATTDSHPHEKGCPTAEKVTFRSRW